MNPMNPMNPDDTTTETETRRGANFSTTHVVRFALYGTKFDYDPPDGRLVGTTSQDLAKYWDALLQGVRDSGASHRVGMCIPRLVVVTFSKDMAGREQKSITSARESCKARQDLAGTPLRLSDYEFSFDTSGMAKGMRVYVYDGRTVIGKGEDADHDPIYGLPINPENYMMGFLYYSAEMANPNGDPAEAGRPRVLYDNGNDFGLITPECLKRMVRDYLETHYNDALYIARNSADDLPTIQNRYAAKDGKIDAAKMSAALIDIRLFGGTVPKADRKMRGPIKIGYAISVDPVEIVEVQGTRVNGYDKEVPVVRPSKKTKKGSTPTPEAK